MAVLAIANPTFKPAARVISTITQANQATVTTTFAHNYVSGTIVRLFIPDGFGMVQANNLQGEITVTGSTTFTIDIDTTNFDPLITATVIDTTDGSGAASGTLSGYYFYIGQSFSIGTQIFYVEASSGALTTLGDGAGTFNTSSGAYTFTGCDASTDIYFNPILVPQSYQYPQCVPTGEINSILTASTKNVLPY